MLKQNSELRAEARQALQGKWPMAAVAALIYSVIAGGLLLVDCVLCLSACRLHTVWPL